MGDVVHGHFLTRLRTSPDNALEGAAEYGLESVVIVGFRHDGEFFFASSEPDSPEVLYFLERAKWELLKMEDQLSEDGLAGPPPRGA